MNQAKRKWNRAHLTLYCKFSNIDDNFCGKKNNEHFYTLTEKNSVCVCLWSAQQCLKVWILPTFMIATKVAWFSRILAIAWSFRTKLNRSMHRSMNRYWETLRVLSILILTLFCNFSCYLFFFIVFCYWNVAFTFSVGLVYNRMVQCLQLFCCLEWRNAL